MQSLSLVQILNLTSTTTPALVSNAFHADPTWGNGKGLLYSRPDRTVIRLQVVRAGTLTGVVFKVQGSFDGTTWTTVHGYLASTGAGTDTNAPTVAAGAAGTFEDWFTTADLKDVPLLRVIAESQTANAGAGDSCSAWVWG